MAPRWLNAGFLVIWLAACLGMPLAALSQTLPPAVVAVIDYQRIQRDAKAAQSIRTQIETRRQRYQEQIAGEEQRLHESDKELGRQRSVLSTEAFAAKRESFENDVAAVQRMVQDRRRQLDDAKTEAFAVLRSNLIEVVGTLSESRGFNLVLPSSEVLLFSSQVDLTDEVLELLDKQLPDVRVPGPAPQ